MSKDNNHEKIPTYIVQQNNQYSVECQIKRATDCQGNGEYCDSHEEAQEWVEEECWIFSGEGWICFTCVESIWRKLVQNRRQKGA